MPAITTPDGVAIAYDEAGSGDPLVLVHGITESRRAWDPLVAPLAERFRVVRVDLRGHGESAATAPYDLATMAGDIGHVVAALDLGRPLMVGHSLGGAVVSAYGASLPCCGIIDVDQPLALSGFQDAVRPLEPALRGDVAGFEGALAAVLDSMVGALAGAERARIEALRRPKQDVVLGIWTPLLESSAADLDALVASIGSAISVPYLSLHGIDPGPDYAGWLAGTIKGATTEVWSDLGHYPHLVQPARFVARVGAFADALR